MIDLNKVQLREEASRKAFWANGWTRVADKTYSEAKEKKLKEGTSIMAVGRIVAEDEVYKKAVRRELQAVKGLDYVNGQLDLADNPVEWDVTYVELEPD